MNDRLFLSVAEKSRHLVVVFSRCAWSSAAWDVLADRRQPGQQQRRRQGSAVHRSLLPPSAATFFRLGPQQTHIYRRVGTSATTASSSPDTKWYEQTIPCLSSHRHRHLAGSLCASVHIFCSTSMPDIGFAFCDRGFDRLYRLIDSCVCVCFFIIPIYPSIPSIRLLLLPARRSDSFCCRTDKARQGCPSGE